MSAQGVVERFSCGECGRVDECTHEALHEDWLVAQQMTRCPDCVEKLFEEHYSRVLRAGVSL